MKVSISHKLEFSITKHLHLICACVFTAFYLAVCLTGYFLIKPLQASVIYTLFFGFVAVFPMVLMWRDIYRDSQRKPLPDFLRF
jgi:hypothetical protein